MAGIILGPVNDKLNRSDDTTGSPIKRSDLKRISSFGKSGIQFVVIY